ncbi:MAG: sulfatase [Actinomycetota bacterium]|nr:sulfatase [Actinomycetota bacterium]
MLILTDDQRWDSLWAMKQTQALIVRPGVNFKNGFVTDPLCCPSRASILTGKYPHGTGIYQNLPPHGGFADFNDTSTVATWLQAAGYRTDLVGKYLNGYAKSRYVPPGWSRWTAFDGPDYVSAGYYNYDLNVDGHIHRIGHKPGDYSTDVLASHAADFIRSTVPYRPIFLYFAPFAPHDPALAPHRYAGRFSHLRPYRPPNFNEGNVRDKPAYVRTLHRLGDKDIREIDKFRERQYRSLLAVDDAVGKIVDALRATGRLSTTMIVFTSDNGLSYGEHRWVDRKQVPYEESIRVPFAVRYDPLTAGAPDRSQLALNIDLAPTFAALANTTAPGAEGLSLLPLLDGSMLGGPSDWRRSFLIENSHARPKQGPGMKVPAYCAARSSRYLYVEYGTGARELYDLANDPYELQNLVHHPAYTQVANRMEARAEQLCTPRPPGFGHP